MEQYYTPSGKTPLLAHVFFILTALIVLPILGTVYAYAIWYIPIPYLNFFITIGFGMGIAFAISFIVIRIGKVRNGLWSAIFCLFGALLALYFHWAVWVDLVINISGSYGTDRLGIATSNIQISQVINLILQPTVLFELMAEINEVGVWGIRGGTVSGGFLTFIWVVEIIIVVFAAIMIGSAQSAKPFCEEENKWFDETDVPPMARFHDALALKKAMVSNDIDALKLMLNPAKDIKKNDHSKISLYDAESGENYVTIDNAIAKENSKGEISFSTENVVSFLKISQEVADSLKGSQEVANSLKG